MDARKALFEAALGRLTVGSMTVTWWDGETKRYGNGEPHARIHIKDPDVASAIVRDPTMGFGEGYMDGLIDVTGDVYNVAALANLNSRAFPKFHKRSFLTTLLQHGSGLGAAPHHSRKHISHHYDLGNDFYALWLDETMTYSCAYFKTERDSLKQAQLQKIDHLLGKLQLRKGMKLLDIGSGWGWLIIRAAQEYGVHAHGITHSKEQLAKTREHIKELGLEKFVTVDLADYRELTGQNIYDRIVSVGMYEHVGRPNHKQYMSAVARLLKPGAISVLHTITKLYPNPTDKWSIKYIFPGGYVPAWSEVVNLLPDYDFHLTDVESLRLHYALTLDHWAKNYEKHVDQIRAERGESFVRMWRLYLRGSAAGFRTGNLDLHQFVFTKGLSNDLPLTREYLYQ